MSDQSTVHSTRRTFLQGLLAGGGLVVATGFATSKVFANNSILEGDFELDLFLKIDSEGLITILAHRSEMGTGIRTTLPLVVADELDATLETLNIVQAIGDPRLGSQNTDGSKSIRGSYTKMRLLGATARTMLEMAAAATWGASLDEVHTKLNAVHHKDGRSLSFGDLASKASEQERPEEETITFKSPEESRYVGKHHQTIDVHDHTVGKGEFGLDVKIDGMVHAVIAHCPVLGGKFKSYDDKKALAIPGVTQVVEMPFAKAPFHFKPLGGLAVIATSTYAAMRGRDALVVEWENGANESYDSDNYRAGMEEEVNKPNKVIGETGDVDQAMKDATSVLKADYYLPHLSHAPMETPCAVAHTTDEGCELWAPTQNPQAVMETVAGTLGIKQEQVTCNVTLLGGGFGRKSKPDYCAEAAWLSRELKQPVQVFWTREDDIRHDYLHSVAAMHMEAGVDESGKPVAWLGRTAFPTIMSTFMPGQTQGSGMEWGMGFANLPFPVANKRFEAGKAEALVRIGWLRSVANIYHVFAVSSFTNELAHHAGQDPAQYLHDLIGDEDDRLSRTAAHCVEQSAWGEKLSKGRGRGLSAAEGFGSAVAVVAEVTVSKAGKLTIDRIDITIDCGLAVSPDRVRAQMEGSVIFGVSLTKFGEITAKNGAIVQGNFDTYPVARMGDTPTQINVHIVDSDGPLGGAGEPGVPPMAPAICEAIFQATGQRIRSLPLSKHDLSWS
ncbi:MAG: xanthine dehydrogenase family protein molybdopterin-binding subunit [Planctomycetes bacterium]|nr:xanthine dehydrogenase family protein molybdopterin-binding subunit [Planctomycetota bacterium]